MSSIVSEVLPTRTLRTREVATYTLVTNRPAPAKQSARRVRDVLQGRQLDVYPNAEAIMLGGRGNEHQTNCLPHALEEALKWLSGEHGPLTMEGLTAAGYQLLGR